MPNVARPGRGPGASTSTGWPLAPGGPGTTTSNVRAVDDVVSLLFDAALTVRERAYAPYSHFAVGAAVLAEDGNVYAGCNVENASFPQGACAETGAISAMVAAGQRRIVAVLTVTDGDAISTCCGGCRQRIREFADLSTPVYAAGLEGVRRMFTVEEMLPASFGPENLPPP